MSDRRPWGRPRKLAGLISLIFLLALAGPGRAADPGPLTAQNWNPETLARIQVPADKPLTFAVLGDSRENPEVFIALLREIDQNPDLALAIHLGDMVKDADLNKYRPFFQQVRANLHKPLLTVIGNHELHGEGGLELYRQLFGPDCYAFLLNRHYFIMFNDAGKGGPDQEQLRWLEGELKKSRSAKTRMVFLHTPLYDPRGGDHHHCLRPEAAAPLLALFKKYKVTHIFAGHIHSYFTGAWERVPYTITGGAGAKLYGADPEHYFYHYLQVSVQGKKLQAQVRRLATEGGK